MPARNIAVSLEYPDNSFENVIKGTVANILPRGLFTNIIVEVGDGLPLTALAPPYFDDVAVGAKVYLSFPASAIHIFHQKSGDLKP